MRSLFHPKYTYTGGDGQTMPGGPELGVQIAQGYAAAFPDGRAEVTSTTVQGDTAVGEFRVRGTHTGELMGVAPTGRSIDVVVCNVTEMKDGLVHTEREYFDAATMWSQLGVLEVPSEG